MRLAIIICFMNISQSLNAQDTPATGYVKLSQSFLYAVRTGDSNEIYILQLTAIDNAELKKQLATDDDKKAFWLNLYNAFVQKLLTENPEKYKSRNSFFSNKQLLIAGTKLSLDDIEHGMLRRSKVKWSLGYLNKLFPSRFEKKFRINKLDYRIHFALNCGAKSCPPIAYYDPEKINMQLELAAKNYLHQETEYDKDAGVVHVPKIMSWFRGDFGGKKGIKNILKKYNIIGDNKEPQIRFKNYDWTLFLNNYKPL